MEARRSLGVFKIEDQFPVDTIVAEFLFKAIRVDDYWTVTQRKEIADPQSVRDMVTPVSSTSGEPRRLRTRPCSRSRLVSQTHLIQVR